MWGAGSSLALAAEPGEGQLTLPCRVAWVLAGREGAPGPASSPSPAAWSPGQGNPERFKDAGAQRCLFAGSRLGSSAEDEEMSNASCLLCPCCCRNQGPNLELGLKLRREWKGAIAAGKKHEEV